MSAPGRKQPELTLPATTGRDLLALPSTHPGGDDDSVGMRGRRAVGVAGQPTASQCHVGGRVAGRLAQVRGATRSVWGVLARITGLVHRPAVGTASPKS